MRPALVAAAVIVGDIDRLTSPGSPPESPVRAFASPKSSTLTLPSGVIFTFAGLRSRWIIPFSCADSSASAIWTAISRTSSTPGRRDCSSFGQVLALDELEHERADAAGLLESVDRRDVRVVQRGQQLGFTLEAAHPLRVAV